MVINLSLEKKLYSAFNFKNNYIHRNCVVIHANNFVFQLGLGR